VAVRLELHQLLEQMVLTLFFHLLLLQVVAVVVEVTQLVRVALAVRVVVVDLLLLMQPIQDKEYQVKAMLVELWLALMVLVEVVVLEQLV
jgi:hypothetical protein